MRKKIGIVSEGPTDYLMLKTAIDTITGEDNIYLSIQPEADMLGRYGFGWKGVWRWCKESENIAEMMNGIQPGIDVLIIQMDGDVARKEKEVHCLCDATDCGVKGDVFPLYCNRKRDDCPIELPCASHEKRIDEVRKHGVSVLKDALGDNEYDKNNIIITIPCDSTDAWIVAAYDEDLFDIEDIENPWKNIIAKGKYYHNIRVRGDKKNTVAYAGFMDKVAENWGRVTEKCNSAKLLEEDVKRILVNRR